MDLVHNERVKLSATFLNGVAIALFAVGALAPAVAIVNSGLASTLSAVLIAVCTAGSGALHGVARYLLGGLRS